MNDDDNVLIRLLTVCVCVCVFQLVHAWSFCRLVQHCSRGRQKNKALNVVQVMLVTLLLLVVPVAAAGPECAEASFCKA